MRRIRLFMLLSVATLAVSARAQETVGGLVCGQTYGVILLTISVQTGIPFRILHCRE